MIHFQECRGKVTVHHVQVKLVKVSWLLHLVKQLWKAKNPERSKSSTCSRPRSSLNGDETFWKNALPLKGVVTWVTIFFLCVAFWNLVWHGSERIWQWKNEEIKKRKWNEKHEDATLAYSCEDSLQTLSMLNCYWLITKLYISCTVSVSVSVLDS